MCHNCIANDDLVHNVPTAKVLCDDEVDVAHNTVVNGIAHEAKVSTATADQILRWIEAIVATAERNNYCRLGWFKLWTFKYAVFKRMFPHYVNTESQAAIFLQMHLKIKICREKWRLFPFLTRVTVRAVRDLGKQDYKPDCWVAPVET